MVGKEMSVGKLLENINTTTELETGGQGVAQGPGIRGKWNQEPEEEISARRGSGRQRRGIIGREGGIHS